MFKALRKIFAKEETVRTVDQILLSINDNNHFKEYDTNLIMEIYSNLEDYCIMGPVVQLKPYVYSMMLDNIEYHVTEEGMGKFIDGEVIVIKTDGDTEWERVGELPVGVL